MAKLEMYEIDYQNPLGKGSYGTVYKAKHRETMECAAAKRIMLTSTQGQENKVKLVQNEIALLTTLGDNHNNIVKLLLSTEEKDGQLKQFWILTEFCSLHDLEKYAAEYKLTTGNHLDIMLQSAKGLAYMHSQDPPIIHRDIKPSNILMTEEGGKHVVKLADFGVARIFLSDQTQETMTTAGTKSYMGPELFDKNDYWPKTTYQHHKSGAQDAWAHGLVSYQLVSTDPGKKIDFPEITETCIGNMMLKIREIEDEIEIQTKKWKDRIKTAMLKAKSDEEKRNVEESMTKKMEEKEQWLRSKLWAARKLDIIKNMEPTKDWNPIIIHESDSDVVKKAKQLIQTQVRFEPKERSTMAQVVEQLEAIMKMLPEPIQTPSNAKLHNFDFLAALFENQKRPSELTE